MSVWIQWENIYIFSNRNCVKSILYHICIVRFCWLDDIFFMQLEFIYIWHHKSCVTICRLLKNFVFCLIYLILLNNQQFQNYKIKYSMKKVNEEINRLISSFWLQNKSQIYLLRVLRYFFMLTLIKSIGNIYFPLKLYFVNI